jgi:hypothetical protein
MYHQCLRRQGLYPLLRPDDVVFINGGHGSGSQSSELEQISLYITIITSITANIHINTCKQPQNIFKRSIKYESRKQN